MIHNPVQHMLVFEQTYVKSVINIKILGVCWQRIIEQGKKEIAPKFF
jgi:hypothetical protein